MAQKYDPNYVSDKEMDEIIPHEVIKYKTKKPKIYRIREQEYKMRYGEINCESFVSSDAERSNFDSKSGGKMEGSTSGLGNENNYHESVTNMDDVTIKTSAFDMDSASFANKITQYTSHLYSDKYASQVHLGSTVDIFDKEILEITEESFDADLEGEYFKDKTRRNGLRNSADLKRKTKKIKHTADKNKMMQWNELPKKTEKDKTIFDVAKENIVKVEKRRNAKILLRQLQITTAPKRRKKTKNVKENEKSNAGKELEEDKTKKTEEKAPIVEERETYESLCQDVNKTVVEIL